MSQIVARGIYQGAKVFVVRRYKTTALVQFEDSFETEDEDYWDAGERVTIKLFDLGTDSETLEADIISAVIKLRGMLLKRQMLKRKSLADKEVKDVLSMC